MNGRPNNACTREAALGQLICLATILVIRVSVVLDILVPPLPDTRPGTPERVCDFFLVQVRRQL